MLLYLYINLFMRIIMDIIKFNTTLKASGKDYFKIVFWNRFIRNPIELILSWLPAVISLVLLCLHYYSSFLLILYAVCWFYPIYIFGYQFSIRMSSLTMNSQTITFRTYSTICTLIQISIKRNK